TVTFGWPKVAHVSLPAAGACGRLVVADIGLLGTEASGDDTVTARDLVSFFPRRKADAHKGSQGRLAVAGGSMGLAGPVGLAARASHRSGAGLVTVLAPENVRPLAHLLSPESTTASFDADLSRFDALALGPGLGLSHESRFTFRRLAPTPLPAVFDADAL